MWCLAGLFLATFLFLGNGIIPSQPPPQQAPQIKPDIKSNSAIQNQENSKPHESDLPATPPASHLAISHDSNPAENGEDGDEKGTEFWSPLSGYRFKITDSLLVLFTLVLAVFTGLLWNSTKKLWKEAEAASAIATKSAHSAEKAADAAYIASIPILSPQIIDTASLHPPIPFFAGAHPFTSSIKLVFDNYGKTPGIVRQVRADLILTENDILPEHIDFEDLPLKGHEIMIPGDTRWSTTDPLPGWEVEPPVARDFTLSGQELMEVLAEATPTGKYRRFYLIGLIIYDDFFEYRHTHRFCIKMRQNRFQSPKGGRRYNRVTHEKIPKDEPMRP
jgi:hypothetical protein